jgi:hypothetical protein
MKLRQVSGHCFDQDNVPGPDDYGLTSQKPGLMCPNDRFSIDFPANPYECKVQLLVQRLWGERGPAWRNPHTVALFAFF